MRLEEGLDVVLSELAPKFVSLLAIVGRLLALRELAMLLPSNPRPLAHASGDTRVERVAMVSRRLSLLGLGFSKVRRFDLPDFKGLGLSLLPFGAELSLFRWLQR